MYTSGTTGFPKGVMQGHNVIRNVLDQANRAGVTPDDATLDYLPLYHAFAVYTAVLTSPATGSRHVLMSHFDAGEALRLIEAERITMIHGFDTHYKDLLEHPSLASRDLSSLRTGVLAAGMLSTEPIARRAQALFPTMTGYGMTEIGVGATGSFLDSDAEVRTTMSGWPLNGYEIQIVDPASGRRLPPGEVGEICVRGYQVMQGYYRKPEETTRAIDAGGWFHTGDSGLLRADGCMRFLGRYKDLLKVGGENVDPTEIEGLLLEDARINHVAVVAHARRPAVGDPGRLRRAGERRGSQRARRDRPLPRAHRQLQGSPPRVLRRRVSDDRQRQDPEVPAARRSEAASRRTGRLTAGRERAATGTTCRDTSHTTARVRPLTARLRCSDTPTPLVHDLGN